MMYEISDCMYYTKIIVKRNDGQYIAIPDATETDNIFCIMFCITPTSKPMFVMKRKTLGDINLYVKSELHNIYEQKLTKDITVNVINRPKYYLYGDSPIDLTNYIITNGIFETHTDILTSFAYRPKTEMCYVPAAELITLLAIPEKIPTICDMERQDLISVRSCINDELINLSSLRVFTYSKAEC